MLEQDRTLNGLTQKALSRILGVDESTIRTRESGRNQPTCENLRRLARLLGRLDQRRPGGSCSLHDWDRQTNPLQTPDLTWG